MTKTIEVTAYGARGDGQTNDMPAIRAAIDACQTNDELVFPAPPAGYLVGPETVFTIAAGVRVTGAARLPQGFVAPAMGIALVGDTQGVIDARRGYAFDGNGGFILGPYDPIVFPGGGVGLPDGSGLVPVQSYPGNFWAMRLGRSHDGFKSIEMAEWILNEQAGPFAPTGWKVGPVAGTMALTLDGGSDLDVGSGLDLRVTDGAGKGQQGHVVARMGDAIVVRLSAPWATEPDATTRMVIGTNFFDGDLAVLSDGTLLCACEQIGASGSAIRFARSSDGGRTWRSTAGRISAGDSQLPKPTPGGAIVAAVKLLRLQRARGRDRVVALFCSTVFRPSGIAQSEYVLAFSDDAFDTVNTMRGLGVGTIDGLDNEINDGNHAAIYQREGSDDLNIMIPLWNHVQPESNRIYQIVCDVNGHRRGDARQVAMIPFSTHLEREGRAVGGGGCFPHVMKLTTGEYGLYFSGDDFTSRPKDHGAMYFMSSPDGSLGSFAGVRRLWLLTGFPNGYGDARPVRLSDGRLVVINSAVTDASHSQIRVFNQYGA
jgi:hypothetical protein